MPERGTILHNNPPRSMATRGARKGFRRTRPSGRGFLAATVPVFALLAALTSTPCPASDPEIERRLAFLKTRLDESRDAVRLWQNGWTAVYGGAAIAYAGMALDADESDDRTLHALGALRATVAATLLSVRPHPGRDGADRIRALGSAPPADRLAAAPSAARCGAMVREEKSARSAENGGHEGSCLHELAMCIFWHHGPQCTRIGWGWTAWQGQRHTILSLPGLRQMHSRLLRK